MKFWEENTEVTFGLNLLFQERDLQVEVVLLAEKVGHATPCILEGTDWGAFCQHPSNIEAAFLQHLFEALWLTPFCCHFLQLPSEFNLGVIHWDHSIFLFSLFPPFDLFILNARRASSLSEACAEDWSKTNSATHPGCASSKISIALSI